MQELWAQGTIMYTCMVLVVNLETALIQQYWNWVIHFTIWGTIIFWFAFLCVFQYVSPVRLSSHLSTSVHVSAKPVESTTRVREGHRVTARALRRVGPDHTKPATL